MKKNFVFMLFASLFTSVNCFAQSWPGQEGSADKILVNQTQNEIITQKIQEAFKLLGVNTDVIKTTTGISSFNMEDFDFVNLYSSNLIGDAGVAVTALYKGNTGSQAYAFVIYKDGDNYRTPMLVKTLSDRSSLAFYNLSEGKILKIEKVHGSFSYVTSSANFGGRASGDCGQAVNDCVIDAYATHGWASVWAFLQTIFVPQTAVAIIVACVLHNCH